MRWEGPGPVRRHELRVMVASVLVAIALTLLARVFLDYAQGETEWTALVVTGVRILRLVPAVLLVLLAIDLVRGRSALPMVLALALVVPAWTWASVGYSDGGIFALADLRQVRDAPEVFTDVAVVGAVGWVAVLAVVVLAAALVVVPFVRWFLTSDEPVGSGQELIAATVIGVLLLGYWSVRLRTQTVDYFERQAPAILRWELLDGAPVVDRLLRLAAVLLTLGLLLAVTRFPASTRRRAWLVGAAASGALFLSAATTFYDGRLDMGPAGESQSVVIEPTVAGLVLPLALVAVFLLAAWAASSRVPSPAPAPKTVDAGPPSAALG